MYSRALQLFRDENLSRIATNYLILFTALTFNTSCYLLYFAVLAGLRLPLTTVNGGGFGMCTWSRLPDLLVKEFSVLNFEANCLWGVILS